jgi:hypothetical protein
MRKHLVLLLLLLTGIFCPAGHARHSPAGSAAVKTATANWDVVIDDPEEVSSGQWRVTAHGTNTSGGTLYNCTATIFLQGAGEVFPADIQNMGDVADQETVDAEWTVKTGGDLDSRVEFRGCVTARPCN